MMVGGGFGELLRLVGMMKEVAHEQKIVRQQLGELVSLSHTRTASNVEVEAAKKNVATTERNCWGRMEDC